MTIKDVVYLNSLLLIAAILVTLVLLGFDWRGLAVAWVAIVLAGSVISWRIEGRHKEWRK